MAYTTIVFTKETTGQIREAPVGLSWTTFFFGVFPALFRGDWKWAVIMTLIGAIAFWLSDFVFMFILSNLIFMFIYNKIYIKDLVLNGFKAKTLTKGNMNDLDDISNKIGITIPRVDAK